MRADVASRFSEKVPSSIQFVKDRQSVSLVCTVGFPAMPTRKDGARSCYKFPAEMILICDRLLCSLESCSTTAAPFSMLATQLVSTQGQGATATKGRRLANIQQLERASSSSGIICWWLPASGGIRGADEQIGLVYSRLNDEHQFLSGPRSTCIPDDAAFTVLYCTHPRKLGCPQLVHNER